MDDRQFASIRSDGAFLRLMSRRRRLQGGLTAILLLAYFGFVFATASGVAVASGPAPGHLSACLMLPVALIVLPVLLTGVYVLRANLEFDVLTRTILEEAERGAKGDPE